MNRPSGLDATNIEARRGARTVLHGVSMSLTAGEIVAIVGPNGAGKSTLLRCLAGLLRPASGTIEVDGVPLAQLDARARARRIAYVPQSARITLPFTVADIVRMGRHPYHSALGGANAEDERIVQEVMASAQLTPLADRPVTQLSGGEQQRVHIARAMAQRTPFLLLDEPLANLDLKQAYDFTRLLGELVRDRQQGVAIVLHDLESAARLADRAVLLHEGAVVHTGDPREVFTTEHLAKAYGINAALAWDAQGPRMRIGP